jgi:hypothetical protein
VIVKRESMTADWPDFDAPLLQEVAGAFRRRRMAIAYQQPLSCAREFTESNASAVERLTLVAGTLRLSIWSDGVLWLAVCVRASVRNAGWSFQDSFHGDVRDVSAESLVRMFEATLALTFGSNPAEERQQLRAVWSRVHPYAG